MEDVFGDAKHKICHLDYGSGYGTLSTLLRANGWATRSYDPFFQDNNTFGTEKFDLITAIEVFEHVPHPYQLMDDLVTKLQADGVLYLQPCCRTAFKVGVICWIGGIWRQETVMLACFQQKSHFYSSNTASSWLA
ncbi:MAG: class I SAM-dependent methyltransferase [Dechloromonas sp.]|nr:MAG: class I SAM-dependent methyltransferase [Dechloromonas sp.]